MVPKFPQKGGAKINRSRRSDPYHPPETASPPTTNAPGMCLIQPTARVGDQHCAQSVFALK